MSTWIAKERINGRRAMPRERPRARGKKVSGTKAMERAKQRGRTRRVTRGPRPKAPMCSRKPPARDSRARERTRKPATDWLAASNGSRRLQIDFTAPQPEFQRLQFHRRKWPSFNHWVGSR